MTKIVKVPGINALGKTKGMRNSGNAVMNELKNIYSNEKGVVIEPELLDFEEINLNNENIEEQEDAIFQRSREIMEENNRVAFLGGDHSISYATGKAFLDYCIKKGKTPCLIVFDAHPDCMKPMKNPTHEEWLRALIEEGFPAHGVLLVGARNSDREEIKFLAENNIKQINLNQLSNNPEETTDMIMEFASGDELYVSFDIDCVDPAFAPSTGYPEAGGLTGRQACYILGRMSLMKNLKALDIVEIDSENDGDKKTIKLGAKILAEFL
jgi:arginase family enzyme